MESQRFTLDSMMNVVYRMAEKLPAPQSCNNEQLDELWYKLLDEYDNIVEKTESSRNTDGYSVWAKRLSLVEKDLAIVEDEWLRRHPCNEYLDDIGEFNFEAYDLMALKPLEE
jgi:hypothetical protein